VPVHSLSSRPGRGTPKGSIWTGCFGFESSLVVSSIQKRSFGHRTILYKLNVFIAISLLCETLGSQHGVAVWGLSATTRRRKRGLFLWNLSQKENPRVVSGRSVREEVCTLYRWGTQLAPEKTVVGLAWGLAVGLLCGKSEQQSHPMYVFPVDASLNKSLSIHRALYLVTCPSAVWQTIELSRPYLHIPQIKTHVSIKVLCKVPATPNGQNIYLRRVCTALQLRTESPTSRPWQPQISLNCARHIANKPFFRKLRFHQRLI
jgi:hypothetical protein